MRVAGGHDLFRVTTILKEQMANYVQRVLSCISTLHTLMWRAYVLFSLATCTCLAGGGGWFWNERLMWAHVLSIPFSPWTVDVRVASEPYWGYHIIIKKQTEKPTEGMWVPGDCCARFELKPTSWAFYVREEYFVDVVDKGTLWNLLLYLNMHIFSIWK